MITWYKNTIGAIVRKARAYPTFSESSLIFSSLGLEASKASMADVRDKSIKLMLFIRAHPWAYPPTQVAHVMHLIWHAEWLVKTRNQQQGQNQQSQKAEQGKNKQSPKQATPSSEWRMILGVSMVESNILVIKKAYRKLAQVAHPDRGGTTDSMAQLNWAMSQARQELKFV